MVISLEKITQINKFSLGIYLSVSKVNAVKLSDWWSVINNNCQGFQVQMIIYKNKQALQTLSLYTAYC